jgi:GTP-binding protein HflX
MARQSGRTGSGSRGPGETQKEQDIRYINQRITKIKRELQKLEKTRGVQRKQRLSSNLPQISIIGYTNAGKSSLLNALTHNTALAEDRLFATLDTTTREFYIDGEKQALLSDTVGFIQQLPHTLIEAFKSTLRELAYADLLVHVVDISDPNWRLHITVVHDVLDELEVDKPVLYVFNKADLIENRTLIESALEPYEPHLVISTKNQADIQHLVNYLRNWIQNTHT